MKMTVTVAWGGEPAEEAHPYLRPPAPASPLPPDLRRAIRREDFFEHVCERLAARRAARWASLVTPGV